MGHQNVPRGGMPTGDPSIWLSETNTVYKKETVHCCYSRNSSLLFSLLNGLLAATCYAQGRLRRAGGPSCLGASSSLNLQLNAQMSEHIHGEVQRALMRNRDRGSATHFIELLEARLVHRGYKIDEIRSVALL